MQIILNGEPRRLENGASIEALINQLELGGKRIAVEVNEELVPRSEHAEHLLQPGDNVEIVQAIGGG